MLPGGDRRPAGVVYPASTAEVQASVRLANEHRFPRYSISTGENRGLGLKSPIQPGCLMVEVGKRMNRILEIDETLCFIDFEPGVTYRQMYDELGRRGHTLMMDTTSGPPNGGIVGNTLDKGAGYTVDSRGKGLRAILARRGKGARTGKEKGDFTLGKKASSKDRL
ncbi:MAG TPA: FAD-dependent oxidoreductase [Methylomirabilota bacterium]|nr:FAD-dependent oxidoreductase [Methylomirabilota bacterium]